MNQTWMKKGISLLLVSAFVLSPGISSASRLEELNKKKEETQSQIKEKNTAIENISSQKDELYSEIAVLDIEIEKVGAEIEESRKEIDSLKISIEKTQKEIDDLKSSIALREEEFKKRLVTMYINSKTGYAEALLGTENVDDLLSKATMMSYISNYDKDILNSLKHDKITLDVKESELQGEKTAAEIAQRNLEEKSLELENAATKKQDKMAALEGSLMSSQEEVEALQAEASKIDGDIDAEKKAIAEAKARAAREALARAQAKEKAEREAREAKAAEKAKEKVKEKPSGEEKKEEEVETSSVQNAEPVSTGSGALGWPVPSSHNLTSYYGFRVYPFGGHDFHMGVDIAAPSGAAIAASADGVITYAAPMGTYGNLVKLRHFDGKETYYAHCSGFNVSIGQKVSKGQTIAYIGSTGNSTGPHLHYEVRVGGSHTNPLNYIN